MTATLAQRLNEKDFFFFNFNKREVVQILLYQEVFEIFYSVKSGDKMQVVRVYEFRERLVLCVWMSFAQILFETISICFRSHRTVKF